MKRKKSAQHLNKYPDWNSPPCVVEVAKQMGPIDTDPCSSDEANELIGAKKIFTRQQNGLAREWEGNIWNNPPSSCKNEKGKLTACRRIVKRKIKGVLRFVESDQCICGLPKKFWERTAEHILSGKGEWAFYLMFNIEQMDVLSSCPSPPHHWQIAFLRRISYFREGKEGVAPPHSSALVFLTKNGSKKKLFREIIEEKAVEIDRGRRRGWFILCEET